MPQPQFAEFQLLVAAAEKAEILVRFGDPREGDWDEPGARGCAPAAGQLGRGSWAQTLYLSNGARPAGFARNLGESANLARKTQLCCQTAPKTTRQGNEDRDATDLVETGPHGPPGLSS